MDCASRSMLSWNLLISGHDFINWILTSPGQDDKGNGYWRGVGFLV